MECGEGQRAKKGKISEYHPLYPEAQETQRRERHQSSESSHPGSKQNMAMFLTSVLFLRGSTHMLEAYEARPGPVPQWLGEPAACHCCALSRGVAVVPKPLSGSDLGCLANSPFFNKTKNKKVGQKILSTQNECRFVLNL